MQNVPLVSNGQRKRVTEENKEDYLNALAWFRLATKPSKQIQSFIKGNNFAVLLHILNYTVDIFLSLMACTYMYVHARMHAQSLLFAICNSV